jgi:hypothetical protein
MKYYVIYKNKSGKIVNLHIYDTEKNAPPIEKAKEAISEWKDKSRTPILIEDKNIIEILDYVYRFEDNKDLQERADCYEEALRDIYKIADKAL